jgi:hypothetical protein
MLTPGLLDPAFRIYWDEMDRCRSARAYWALLHVTVCLPDICAALQSANGETKGSLYVAWSDQYLVDPVLSGSECWQMRCKVLHQGRSSIAAQGRYAGFSFAQPAANGQVDHKRLEGTTLVLDVGMLAGEMRAGVERWIRDLELHPSSDVAANTQRNLPSLIQVRQFPLPPIPGVPLPLTPTIINRSS